eukprot:5407409-Lingulodinium_polyedra.AAC.1
MRKAWRAAADRAGLEELQYVMYQLRHGGARWDALRRLRAHGNQGPQRVEFRQQHSPARGRCT